MLSTSLKFTTEIYASGIVWIPSRINWANYIDLWQKAPFSRFILNSVILSAAIVSGRLILVSMAAYGFSKVQFIGREFFFVCCLATLIIPEQVNIIPNYMLLSSWKLVNTYAGVILPFYGFGVAFGVFLLRQHFLTIPHELQESAILDGCGHWRFFMQIVIPLSKTVISAYTIFAFMEAWNAYLWPLVITHSTLMRPIQVGLSLFRSQESGDSWGLVMAGSVIATLPTLLLFLAAQKRFISSITLTGLKG